MILRLEHVEKAADDEATAADDLRNPVRGVEAPLRREVARDAGQCSEASDAEDGGTKQLGGAGEEAQLVEVAVAKFVPGRTPPPVFRGGGGLGDGAEMGLGSSDEIVLVLVMMAAGVVTGDECDGGRTVGVGVDELFDGPAEAGCVVGVDGFEDEKQRTDLEKDNGADKGGDAAAVVGLAFERCRGAF